MKILNNINFNNTNVRFAGEQIVCGSCGAELLLEKSDPINKEDPEGWQFKHGRYIDDYKLLSTIQDCKVFSITCPSCGKTIYFVIPTKFILSNLIDIRRYKFGCSEFYVFDNLYDIYERTEDFRKKYPTVWDEPDDYGESTYDCKRINIPQVPGMSTSVYDVPENMNLKEEYKKLFGVEPPKDSIERLLIHKRSHSAFGDSVDGGMVVNFSSWIRNCQVWLDDRWQYVNEI